ncbi:MAG: D-alanyl-D-alanine carboxypeptidase [Caulobacteraceae bacterium]|nr:D-alanyl-D-alanine carboxypeptidase [Caulobacteraceae bacterium]
MRIVAGAFVALFALGVAAPASAQDRYSAIVMDARTNEVLLEDQADEARFPASLTKMMTLYMLFESIERGDMTLDTRLTASRNAARQPPSRLGLACSRRRGCDSITVDQAIRALAVQSANDVAVMVAERLGGTESRFSANMTARARELGMSDSRFANASGLPDTAHRTTARDMATLSLALWRDFPQYYHYFQTPSFAWRRTSGRNHNRLLGSVDGVDGIKTGYTRASGFNLATMTERGGRRVIVVVLGGETAAARDAQVAYLIEGAYQEYARRADPNAAQFASLPTRRLDVQLAPGTLQANAVTPLPPSPYQMYQGMVIETLSPVRAPIDEPVGQGDEGTTEEME